MSESIETLKQYVEDANWVTRSYFAVGIIILLERLILVGEVNEGWAGYDWFRWLLLTLVLPIIVILFGVLSNLDRGREQTTQESIFETLSLTIFIFISAMLLTTATGAFGTLMLAYIPTVYVLVLTFLAIYALISLMK